MAAEPSEQPVLLTEGSFAQDDTEKQEKSSASQQLESSEQAESSFADPPQPRPRGAAFYPPPPASEENSRPVTAPEQSISDVERSVMGALSASQSPLLDGNADGDELGDDALETLSQKLANVPSEAGDEKEEEYVAPPEDPYMRAVNYMERHKVMQIFQKLTAEIVYHRPPDPLEHMLTELAKMKKERDARIDDIVSAASSK
ncbi:uncharacterized protein [Diadema setosum]|uniref:uncharacterized protein n=1 Tax=Diadema setosum TaxID=31175 RepID=UPI003B3AD6FD